MTGDDDFNRPSIESTCKNGFTKDDFKNVSLLEVPKKDEDDD